MEGTRGEDLGQVRLGIPFHERGFFGVEVDCEFGAGPECAVGEGVGCYDAAGCEGTCVPCWLDCEVELLVDFGAAVEGAEEGVHVVGFGRFRRESLVGCMDC